MLNKDKQLDLICTYVDNGTYKLYDGYGDWHLLDYDNLIYCIKNGSIRVLNLDYSIDGGLVNKNIEVPGIKIDGKAMTRIVGVSNSLAGSRLNPGEAFSLKFKYYSDKKAMATYVGKVKTLGIKIVENFPALCTHVIIKDTQIEVVSNKEIYLVSSHNAIFDSLYLHSLDLRGVNVQYMLSLQSMFSECLIDNLDMSGLQFVNVQTLGSMFKYSFIHDLKLTDVNFRNLKRHDARLFDIKIVNNIIDLETVKFAKE